MNLGDICWVELPPANGHEQVGRRPAVILQDEAYAGTLPVVIVVPLTGTIPASRFPGTVLIDPTPGNGLRTPSVVLVFQVRAVDRRKVREKIGTIGAEPLAQIYKSLDQLIGRVPSG